MRSAERTGQYMRLPNAAAEAELWRRVARMAGEVLRLHRGYDESGDPELLRAATRQSQVPSNAVLHGLHARFSIDSDATG